MHISECLADISAWTAVHHLKLNLSKTEFGERLPSNGPIRHCWGCHGIAFVGVRKPGRNPWWCTVLGPQHYCCGPILQICPLQHPHEPVFPQNRHNANPDPSTGHLLPGLLQLPLGWTSRLCGWTIAVYPEHCSKPGFTSYIHPNSPIWPPSSAGVLLQPASDSRRWCWPSWLSMELHLSTSKYRSDYTPQQEHFTLLHQLASWYPHAESKQRLLGEVAFSVLAPQWWNELPTNIRTAESLSILL